MGAVVEQELLGERAVARPVVRVAVVGATGYVGRELIALLARHPRARVERLMSSGRGGDGPRPAEEFHPALRGQGLVCDPLSLEQLEAAGLDLVFLATPHATSHEVAPQLLERGLRVVDLSGAFRMKDK